jgi:hypothetical protein
MDWEMDNVDHARRGQASGYSRREFLGRATAGLGAIAGLPLFGKSDALDWLAHVQTPAPVRARRSGNNFSLENSAIRSAWEISPAGIELARLVDLRTGRTLAALPGIFSLALDDGTRIEAGNVKLEGEPRIEPLEAHPEASRFAARVPGKQITARFVDTTGRVRIRWRGILRDGSRYLRQEIDLQAARGDVLIREIRLLDLSVPGIAAAGTVKGSPVVAGDWFFGFEHPLSETAVESGVARAFLTRELPLEAGHTASYSSVIGAVDSTQMRRDFLTYVERERAHPYRTFLHYNSWYDLGYFTPYNQAEAVDAIQGFGEALHVRRGVALSSFLFDDGWDNHEMWGFNSGFPHGFTPLRRAAARYGAAPGVWLSPWGGYDKPRQERIAWARAHGYETDREGLALAGPKYFARFREVALEFIHKYGVNQFKLDGTGSAATTVPGSRFDSDFDAAISLIGDLRAAAPDLYINLTTGTYPSPFWLRWADSTWRGGSDHDFTGAGSDRQRWITYRDAATFEHVVLRGPLYPLNSLMLHGLIYARYAKGLHDDPRGDFGDEIRSYFGTGTQLQEMYITHSLLSEADWNTLAEAANWSRQNAGVLVDTHWVGGDPAKLEPYGWAAWSPRKTILTLRNPSDRRQTFELDVTQAFESPANAAERYQARSPWKKDASRPAILLEAGKRNSFALEPFEVLTLEGVPARS